VLKYQPSPQRRPESSIVFAVPTTKLFFKSAHNHARGHLVIGLKAEYQGIHMQDSAILAILG